MRTASKRVLSVGVAAVMAAGAASAAQASSTNVVTAIKAQDKIISKTIGYKELNGKIQAKTPAQARRLITNLDKLEKISAHSVDIVAASTASSAKQREGKQDWIKGSREQNRGLLQLDAALKDVLDKKVAAFKREYPKAIKTFAAGTKLGIKGDKLLGLPITD